MSSTRARLAMVTAALLLTACSGGTDDETRGEQSPTPEGPESPVSDLALIAAADSVHLDADFNQLDEPYRLITPAAVVTVTASAELDTVPDVLVAAAGEADGSGDDGDALRPADGQAVRAWQITVGPPPEIAPPPRNTGIATGQGRDATTSLFVDVGGILDLVGDLSTSAEPATYVDIYCESVQCPAIGPVEYVLLTSGPSGESAGLIAHVGETEQRLSLEDGSLDTGVSTVAYSRESLTQQVSTTWEDKTLAIRTEDQVLADQPNWCCYGDVTFTYGGGVEQVYLSPFDFALGWAPAGKAWLVVPVNSGPRPDDSVYVSTLDLTKSWTLTVGETSIPSEPPGEYSNVAVFQVDDTFTEGTFAYSPVGVVDAGEMEYPIPPTDPLTAQISFP